MQETWVRSLSREDPLEKEQATDSSILAWEIPWTQEPWSHKDSDMTEQLTLSSILAWEIPMDRGTWRATGHRVAKSWTRLSMRAQ